MKTIICVDFILPSHPDRLSGMYTVLKALFQERITKDITYRNMSMVVGDEFKFIFMSYAQDQCQFLGLPQVDAVVCNVHIPVLIADILRTKLIAKNGQFIIL